MTIPFTRIPGNWRAPLFFVEFDNSMANTATATQRTLLIGLMLDSGTAAPGTPSRVSSPNSVAELTGKGSMLHSMATAYVQNDTSAEIWIMPLAPTEAMIAAAGSIKIASAPASSGIISLYIAGTRVQMSVMAADTAVQIAAGLAAAINKNTALPVVASVESSATDTVKLVAKNPGT
ncbi:TPA: hypothetical protein ACTY9J_001322 [Raoultella ornithinolytica]